MFSDSCSNTFITSHLFLVSTIVTWLFYFLLLQVFFLKNHFGANNNNIFFSSRNKPYVCNFKVINRILWARRDLFFLQRNVQLLLQRKSFSFSFHFCINLITFDTKRFSFSISNRKNAENRLILLKSLTVSLHRMSRHVRNFLLSRLPVPHVVLMVTCLLKRLRTVFSYSLIQWQAKCTQHTLW